MKLMQTRSALTVVAFLFMLAVSACGGSGGSGGGAPQPEEPPTMTPPDTEPPEVETPPPETQPPVLQPPEVESAFNTDFGTTECGMIPDTIRSPGTEATQANPLLVGEVVSATIDPDDPQNNAHFWRIQMVVGSYLLVLDTARVDGANAEIGLNLTESILNSDQITNTGLTPIDTNEKDNRFRTVLGRTVTGEATAVVDLLIEVKPNFGAENYRLAVLDADTRLPSPYLADCPSVEVLAVDTNLAFDLEASGSAGDEKWFYMETTTGSYELKLDTSRVDGMESTIAYEFRLLNPLGGKLGSNGNDEYSVDLVGVSATDRRDLIFTNSSGGSWAGFFRVRNLTDPLLGEISITRAPSQVANDGSKSASPGVPQYDSSYSLSNVEITAK